MNRIRFFAFSVRVCVCVCVRERERERENGTGKSFGGAFTDLLVSAWRGVPMSSKTFSKCLVDERVFVDRFVGVSL